MNLQVVTSRCSTFSTRTPRPGGPAAPAAAPWARAGRGLPGSRRPPTSIRGQGSLDGSYDSEELDYGLARELEGLAQHDKYTKLASKLQLLYDASEVRCF